MITVRNRLNYRLRALKTEVHAVQQRRAEARSEFEAAEVVDPKKQSQREQATDIARVESLRPGQRTPARRGRHAAPGWRHLGRLPLLRRTDLLRATARSTGGAALCRLPDGCRTTVPGRSLTHALCPDRTRRLPDVQIQQTQRQMAHAQQLTDNEPPKGMASGRTCSSVVNGSRIEQSPRERADRARSRYRRSSGNPAPITACATSLRWPAGASPPPRAHRA
jgi:hypothetical protein